MVAQGGIIKNLETKVQRVTELLEQQSEQLLIIIEANRAREAEISAKSLLSTFSP